MLLGVRRLVDSEKWWLRSRGGDGCEDDILVAYATYLDGVASLYVCCVAFLGLIFLCVETALT